MLNAVGRRPDIRTAEQDPALPPLEYLDVLLQGRDGSRHEIVIDNRTRGPHHAGYALGYSSCALFVLTLRRE